MPVNDGTGDAGGVRRPVAWRDRALDERGVNPDPMVQFGAWFEDAVRSGAPQPEAVCLATATPDGRPSARMVLYKGHDEDGFVFYTNYESHKARELAENPRAALVFYWFEVRRQVRMSGEVSPLSREESERYFATRPREAQLAAWASRQSRVVPSRPELERRFEEVSAEYGGRDVPLPPYWGGYRLLPETIEFWQGRTHRLHDRLRYTRRPEGAWTIERLSP